MLLWAGGAMLLAAGGLAVAAAALWPLPDLAGASPVVAEAGLRPGAADELLPLSAFEPAWQVDLRRPLTDSATVAGTAAALMPGGGPNVRLVGTIVAGGSRPRGVFLVGVVGALELKAVGEKAGGAEVLSIDERSATLSFDGRPVILRLEKIDVLGAGDLPPVPPPSARSSGRAPDGS